MSQRVETVRSTASPPRDPGRRRGDRWLDAAGRLLDRTETRITLAALIIVSVLDMTPLLADLGLAPATALWTLVTLDSVFLVIFGVELAARLGLARRSQGISRQEVALLVIDSVALLTFVVVPAHLLLDPSQIGATRPTSEFWLIRLTRLIRLVVLVRFLNTTLNELRKILSQRQIRYQLGFLLTSVLLLTFVGASVLVTMGVPIADFDHDGQIEGGEGTTFQVVWWVFRQVESPDNLVSDARSDALVLVTSLVLTITGVFVMSFIIGIGTSVVGALLAASRHRQVHLREHTVVVGGGHSLRKVLEDLIEMYGKNKRQVRVAVLDDPELPPAYLEDRQFRGVEYRSGEATTLEAHDLLSTSTAKRVIVLNNEERGESSDAYAVSSVLAARQLNPACPIVVEMRHRRNIEAAHVAGGSNVNAVPMGHFLGCVVSQNVMFPGIDSVFEELFSAQGSEIYTHIYSAAELARLQAVERESVSFGAALLRAFSRSHATLLGVLLGDGEWTDDAGELTLWLNPLDEPSREAGALGARTGSIPVRALRGLVALAPDYSAVHDEAMRFAHDLELDEPCEARALPQQTRVEVGLSRAMVELRHVLVLGDNELLPAMVENTAAFVEGVELVIVTGSRARRDHVADELRRKARAAEPGGDGAALVFDLPGGGRATLLGSSGDSMLADTLACPQVAGRALDAVVLLADPNEADPDANSGLMLLHLLELLREGRLEVSPRFRIIAEAISGPKGELLEQRLGRNGLVPVRMVPTRQMRAYFLVHTAYVPGSDKVHLELLTSTNQDFCQLRIEGAGGEDPTLTYRELLEELAAHDPPVILLALDLGPAHATPGLVLNPQADHSGVEFKLSEVEAVYAVGETTRLVPGNKG